MAKFKLSEIKLNDVRKRTTFSTVKEIRQFIKDNKLRVGKNETKIQYLNRVRKVKAEEKRKKLFLNKVIKRGIEINELVEKLNYKINKTLSNYNEIVNEKEAFDDFRKIRTINNKFNIVTQEINTIANKETTFEDIYNDKILFNFHRYINQYFKRLVKNINKCTISIVKGYNGDNKIKDLEDMSNSSGLLYKTYYIMTEKEKKQDGIKYATFNYIYFREENKSYILAGKKIIHLNDDNSNIGDKIILHLEGKNETSVPDIFFISKVRMIKYLENVESNEIKKKIIKNLRSFSPNSTPSYHIYTDDSTSPNGNKCIYETYYYLYKNNEKKKIKKMLNEMEVSLNKESKEIKEYVKKGEIYNFLKMKSKEHNETMYLEIFPTGEVYIINEDDINITNDIKELDGKKIFCYYKKHVAPRIQKETSKSKIVEENKKNKRDKLNSVYSLKSMEMKESHYNKIKDKVSAVYGYDFETRNNENNEAVPFCVSLQGDKNDKNTKCFYNDNPDKLINDFVDHLDKMKTITNRTKTHERKIIKQIIIYGFNNSRFDNMFLFHELLKRDPCTKYLICGNSQIKYIKYQNISFYDLSLYYAGSLDYVCKSFKIKDNGVKIRKGPYPYTFVNNKDNINYKGEVPELKYWNDILSYNKYIRNELEESKNKYGYEFDCKEYTEKYCNLDARITRNIGLEHLSKSIGYINIKGKKKYYDVRFCKTAASISMKMFQYCGLSYDLYSSPKEIQEIERKCYYGGNTSVYKKSFNSEEYELKDSINKIIKGKENERKKLKYYDINSSYPSSMLKYMPTQFVTHQKYDEEILITMINMISDNNIYYVRSKYIGNNKNCIPNLKIRDEKNNVNSFLETDYNYHWGIEVKEALLNNFEIHFKEVIIYRSSEIFKEFIQYFYNKRLEAKANKNASEAEFIKLILNSLYGKFGQNSTYSNAIVSNGAELYKYTKDENIFIDDFTILKNDTLLLKYYRRDMDNNIGQLVRFSSYIAAASRSKLSEIMRDCGWDNIWYCDTDSIFTLKDPSEKYIDNKELGKWKLEKKGICKYVNEEGNKCIYEVDCIINNFIAVAPKVYTYSVELSDKDKELIEKYKIENIKITEKKSKGVKACLLKDDDYEKMLKGEKIEIKNKMFFRKIDSIKIIDDQKRTIKDTCNKKRIFEGNDSRPYKNYEEWKLKNMI